MVSRILFRAARSDAAGPVVRFTFSYLSPLLPVRRVVNTREIIGFVHPKPSWATHILLVPKVGIPSLIDMPPQRVGVVTEIFRVAKDLGKNIYDGVGPMQLMVNGGTYQDVGQLHFHLICGSDVVHLQSVSPKPSISPTSVTASPHPRPQRAVHTVLQLAMPDGMSDEDVIPTEEQILSLLGEVARVVADEGLRQRGFSLIAGAEGENLDYSCFHLVSGPRVPNELAAANP